MLYLKGKQFFSLGGIYPDTLCFLKNSFNRDVLCGVDSYPINIITKRQAWAIRVTWNPSAVIFWRLWRRHLARLARRRLTATWAASSAEALLVSHGDPGLMSGCLLWPLLCWSPLEPSSVLNLQRISPEQNHKEINKKKKELVCLWSSQFCDYKINCRTKKKLSQIL